MKHLIVPLLIAAFMIWFVAIVPNLALHRWERDCQKYEVLVCAFYPVGCECRENPVLKDIYQRLP